MNYPPPGTNKKFSRIQEIATKGFKRFGPLLITGLVAVAEHHWLKRDGSPEFNNQVSESNIRDDRSSIEELREQVAKLRRMIRRKGKEKDDSTSDSSASSDQAGVPSDYHYRSVPFPGRQTDAPLFGELLCGNQERVAQHPQGYKNITTACEREDPYEGPPPRHRHHHRYSFPRDDFSPEAMHAGKVAALAGAVEALHVCDVQGDWIGPKGVRVGTTMAASFASTYARDRDPENVRTREVLADVGTGLVVSRLVHGRRMRIEEDYRKQRERRWSYWY